MKRRQESCSAWKKLFLVTFLTLFIVILLPFIFAGNDLGPKVAEVVLEGEISSSATLPLSKTITLKSVAETVKRINEDDTILSVLFVINSPGGSVVASREASLLIRSIRKPKVCWLSDMATSGAYWLALSCDKIIADPLTITGSIGVTASFLEFSGFMKKYGIGYERIVSGEMKDIGSPFKNVTSEERREMEYIVNETFNYFLKDVVERRNLTEKQVEKIKSGSIFLGKDAVEAGLIDEVGTYEYARLVAKRLSGRKDVEFFPLGRKKISLLDLLWSL